MLFYKNLDEIIFSKNEFIECDELVIISGYVGPNPIRRLQKLPIKSTVIYGMYGCDGIQQSLHTALLNANNELNKVTIFYSLMPVHAKCYIWKYEGKVKSALVGSANFSNNGLLTPYKEILADASTDTFKPLDGYLNKILENTISCSDAVVKENKRKCHKNINQDAKDYDKDVCEMPLYIIRKGKPMVPEKSGVNWGMGAMGGSHVNINDAYIPIRTAFLKQYPLMFPPKQICPKGEAPRAKHRHNDNIEIIWDDGTTMEGLLEGNAIKELNGRKGLYPKQIASTPNKAELGIYLRKRMGIAEGHLITYEDLKRYGRTTIDVSLQGEGVYYFDFSVK